MKKTLTWLKKNSFKLTVGIIVILAVFSLDQCNKNRVAQKKLAVAEHNISALNDTIRVTKTRDGEDQFNKLALLTNDVKSLKALNAELYDAVKNIKGGKVNTILKETISLVHDTTEIWVNTVLDEEKIVSEFKLDTVYSEGNSRKIEGFTEYDIDTESSKGFITKDSLSLAFVTGIKNLDKGAPEIFITSNYPGFKATKIEGAHLDKKLFEPKNKQQLFTFGLNVGYTPITYSVAKQKLDFDLTRFGASVGTNINLSRLFGKK